jgi:hypothetical protein
MDSDSRALAMAAQEIPGLVRLNGGRPKVTNLELVNALRECEKGHKNVHPETAGLLNAAALRIEALSYAVEFEERRKSEAEAQK